MRIPSRTALVKGQSAPEPPEPEAAPAAAGDGVLEHEIALEAEPAAAAEPPSRPAPAPVPVPAGAAPSAAPEPAFTAATPSEHVRVLRPEAVPERPQLTAVPELEPELEPVPVAAAPEPAPEPPTVVPIGVGAGPRQWNLWDLERLTREHSGDDIAQDEERQFLLMYLREFADSAGLLPLDFDGLVRDSFGELVGTR
jgi:hypothetical protein